MPNSILRSLFKNTAVMMVAQMIRWAGGLVLLLFLPRYIGSEGYGRLYLAISIQMIFGWLIDYGGQTYVPKEVARDKEHAAELFVHSVALRVILWALSIVASFALCLTAHYSTREMLVVMILAVSNLWGGVNWLIQGCYQGFEEMKYPSLASVAGQSFLMVTAVPALLLGAKEVTVAILMGMSTLVSFGLNMKFIRKILDIRVRIRWQTVKSILQESLPYFLRALFGIIYFRIDAVMLSLMTPLATVGWYGAAYRLFDILMFLPSIFSTALFPILSRLGKSDRNSVNSVSEKSLEFLLLIGIPIAVGIVFFAKNFVQIIFGLSQFSGSVIPIQVLAVGMLLVYADFVLGRTVLAIDKQRQWALVALAAIFLNVGTNYVLIAYFQRAAGNGGIGAAAATDLTEMLVLLSAIWLLPRRLFSRRLLVALAKGIASGATMGIVFYVGLLLRFEWLVVAVVGTGVYFACLMLFQTLEPAEKDLLRRSISMKRIMSTIGGRKASA